MNFNFRHPFARWATAAIVAAGAITFVAADGYSYTRRLFVAFNASGGSSACAGIYGGAYAFDYSGNMVCDVNVAAFSGTTNFGNTMCPPSQVGVASYVRAYATPVNTTTGDQGSEFCWGNGPVSWGTSATCSGTSSSGCAVGVYTYYN